MKALALMSSTLAAVLLMTGHSVAHPAASGALLQPLVQLSGEAGPVVRIHKRNYRHCHGRGSQRWCHGPRQPRGSHSGQARPATSTGGE